MPYFLDGNNIIGRPRGTRHPSEEDRAALVEEIAERLRRTNARVLLFFDGPAERISTLGALSIRPCPDGSADDAILREIRQARSPREIVVVTADRELSRCVRDLGAKTALPQEFWKRVGATGSAPADRAPVDVEEWMKYFGDEKNRGGF